ncbi:MAG: DNA integrity scanning diadenylate cyclase DisA [Propionibacteriaceae bacterium]
MLEHLARMAPGTPLREAFERILRGRTGALVVLGRTREVADLSTGGFELDVPFSPTALRELAKMDGAILLEADTDRIVRAGVHLTPEASIATVETGTRHRTADRVARQTGVPVVSVSASMATITLYVDGHRHTVERSADILSRADQALQTMERYRTRLSQVIRRLSALEVEDQVTVRDLALVTQRLEMIRRLDLELADYVVELGTYGRLLNLQLGELAAGTSELPALLELDYRPAETTEPFGIAGLEPLSTAELLEPQAVARAMGFGPSEHLDTKITVRGYRQLAQINRLPPSFGGRLIEHFGSLQAMFGASTADLQEVDGVGESRARIIRDGLTRLAETAYAERVD